VRVFSSSETQTKNTRRFSEQGFFFFKKNGESLALCAPLPLIHVRGAVGPVVFC
jgi:hypothetical protein